MAKDVYYTTEALEIEDSQDIIYPENKLGKAATKEQEKRIDVSYAGFVLDIANIDSVDNDTFAILRRHGLGGSDSSVVLGVNPYKTRTELIKEKASDVLSEEEKAVGRQIAVRKGNDLEPLIIDKARKALDFNIIKPIDMYRCTEYPWLTMNFDGVAGSPGAYFPVEIKVVTTRGERHYNFKKAIYNEFEGFLKLPEDFTETNNSIETKAAFYGIPPYYYTQVQQEMLATGAEFGYLACLTERDWQLHIFFIHRDKAVQTNLISQSYIVWENVCKLNPKREQDATIKSVKTNIEQNKEDEEEQ